MSKCCQCLKEEATMESVCADCFWLEDTIYKKRGPITLFRYENALLSEPVSSEEWTTIVKEWIALNTEREIQRYGQEFVDRMNKVFEQLKSKQPP